MKNAKVNLKLKKITISKLDNLSTNQLKKDQLDNLKGGGDINFTGVEIITIGGGWNDTTHLSSCSFEYDPTAYNYTECISRSS